MKDEKAIAEGFLKEMLKADETDDYELFIKHYEERDLVDFSRARFEDDIKQMNARNGKSLSYEYFGSLQGYRDDDHDGCYRFVWKGIYEKREALIVIGIHRKNDTWFVNTSLIH